MTVEERVRKVIEDQLFIDDPYPLDASLRDDLGADSLDVVELLMPLEEQMGREVPDEELEKLKTVRDVVDLVTRYENENAAAAGGVGNG